MRNRGPRTAWERGEIGGRAGGGGGGGGGGNNSGGDSINSGYNLKDYCNKIVHFSQMDVEYAFSQMIYVCYAPSKLYQLTKWRKQTKNYWARDDPCFVLVLIFFLIVTAIAYALVYPTRVAYYYKFTINFVCIQFLVIGLIISALNKFIGEKNIAQISHTTPQRIEFLYAFDIHCNGFFPLFMLIYVLQYICLPLLLSDSYIAALLSNSIHCLAFTYYHYITFKGYSVLPFIENSQYFLLPIGFWVCTFFVMTVFNYNPTVISFNWYAE